MAEVARPLGTCAAGSAWSAADRGSLHMAKHVAVEKHSGCGPEAPPRTAAEAGLGSTLMKVVIVPESTGSESLRKAQLSVRVAVVWILLRVDLAGTACGCSSEMLLEGELKR